MTTKQLARYYPILTPWERLPLIVAASARGDAVERERLVRSAPRQGFRIPDYWGLAEGLDDLAKLHLLAQLDLAAVYWRFSGLLHQEARAGPSGPERQQDERPWQHLELLCYLFVVRADAWRLLCTQMHIDPEVFLKDLPGYDAVQQMEPVARRLALSAEEALDFLHADAEARRPAAAETPALRRKDQVDTAADVAQSLRAFLQARLDKWR